MLFPGFFFSYFCVCSVSELTDSIVRDRQNINPIHGTSCLNLTNLRLGFFLLS